MVWVQSDIESKSKQKNVYMYIYVYIYISFTKALRQGVCKPELSPLIFQGKLFHGPQNYAVTSVFTYLPILH